jgi:outer membrane protein OmpA-like peptidoglycan-associated protein
MVLRDVVSAALRVIRPWPMILASICFVATGCATRPSIDQKIAVSQAAQLKKIERIQSEVELLEERNRALERKNQELDAQIVTLSQEAKDAMKRAQDAGVLAKGKVVFQESMRLDTIRFAKDSATLSSDAKVTLDNFAMQLRDLGDFYLEIQGHAEPSEANADALARHRGEAVRVYLNRQHAFQLRIMSVIAYGTSAPIARNNTVAGRAANRRVAIVVLDSGERVSMAQQYPLFPWPPPAASGTLPIPRNLLVAASGATTLGDVDTKLQTALELAGYPRGSYFAVPGGFALVTRLEEITRDGTPKALPDRWVSTDSQPVTDFTLLSYLRALFRARPGHYRVLVFVVTPLAFSQAPVTITPAETTHWVETGLNRLPRQIGTLTFTPARYECTALVYEFQRASESDAPSVTLPGAVLPRAHLQKAGVLPALEKLKAR